MSTDDGILVDTDGPLPPTARRILSGLTGQRFDCQTAGHVHTPLDAPWRGSDREHEKTQLYKYVRSDADGAPLSKVVRDVFGQDAVETAGADYQLARRFFRRYPAFRIDRRDGILWVEPTLEAFNLSQQYVNRKTTGRRRDGLSNGDDGGTSDLEDRTDSQTGDDDGDDVGPTRWAKDRARACLSKRGPILDGSTGRTDYRSDLVRELATEREATADKFNIFERVRGSGPDHLLIPYTTRFNDVGRATDIRDGFHHALASAAEDHVDAVVLTVTTDPDRFDSHADALDSLSENKNRLLSWLSTDYQLGYRPENLSVLEFMDNGLPHYHIVIFGRSWLTHQSVLAAKWDDLGTGQVVDVRSATTRDSRWLLHNDDGTTVTLRDYLGKAIEDLVDLAGMDAGDLRDAVDAGDLDDLWKQAIYWTTGRQYYSCSPSLKESDPDDGLPHIKRYEFRGTARYADIPAHVRRNARILDRGRPPPASRTGADAVDSRTEATAD